jgi:hypothetical protein
MEKTSALTQEQLARLGGGVLGYVKEIGVKDAKACLPCIMPTAHPFRFQEPEKQPWARLSSMN